MDSLDLIMLWSSLEKWDGDLEFQLLRVTCSDVVRSNLWLELNLTVNHSVITFQPS